MFYMHGRPLNAKPDPVDNSLCYLTIFIFIIYFYICIIGLAIAVNILWNAFTFLALGVCFLSCMLAVVVSFALGYSGGYSRGLYGRWASDSKIRKNATQSQTVTVSAPEPKYDYSGPISVWASGAGSVTLHWEDLRSVAISSTVDLPEPYQDFTLEFDRAEFSIRDGSPRWEAFRERLLQLPGFDEAALLGAIKRFQENPIDEWSIDLYKRDSDGEAREAGADPA